jgi:BirA family biotin operon repressor/biotin-[acetyl-CoA-carboxylase] ligase
MNESMDLPHVYELVQCDVIDSAVAEAGRLAQAGADEGTLVWTQEQSAALDRFGQLLPSPRGNLYICLVLRPECPLAVAQQLVLVATIGLGLTIAEAAPPMTDLRYQWPNSVLLNNAETGIITFVPGPENAGQVEWLLLGVTAHVNHVPVALDVYSTSLQAEGVERLSAVEVLQGFSRHFLSGINRWDEAGFAQTRKSFMHRMEGLGKVKEVRVKNETIIGKLIEMDEQGALVLEAETGTRRLITVAEYFGLT